MKKRIISLLLATAMLLSMTSCGKKNTNYADMTLAEYIENVELPENLTISIDPETVTERETVKVYENVEYMEFDINALAELLLRNPVTEEEYIDGALYTAQTDSLQEILNVPNGNYGNAGYHYTLQPYWGADKKYISPAEQFLRMAQPAKMYYYGNGSEIDFLEGLYDSADKTLDFASREEASETAKIFFTESGIPQVEVQGLVAYDLDVLTPYYENYQVFYNAYYAELSALDDPTFAEEFVEFNTVSEPQKRDECYKVFCRQLIDGIPINSYNLKNIAGESQWYSMIMSMTYTQDGILEASLYAPMKEPDTSDGTETEILSATEALELAKAYYDKAILSKEYKIEEVELTYIEYYSEESNTATLKPYWLVQVGYQENYSTVNIDTGEPISGELRAYDFLYFDAVNGNLFEGSPSGKPLEFE